MQQVLDHVARSSEALALTIRKAELEIEMLQAQIDAKKAEIKRIKAAHRMAQLAPDLAILEALEKPVPMSFPNETPLEDVLKHVKASTEEVRGEGIPIYVDPVGLQEAEKSMSSTVTLDIQGVPLKTTLRLALKQLGLEYSVHEGVLTITSEGHSDRPE
jgi:hypothetical protein